MTDGIIQKVFNQFQNRMNANIHHRGKYNITMSEVFQLQQELIAEIKNNLNCIFDTEILNDVSIEYGYDLTKKAEQIKKALIGDTQP